MSLARGEGHAGLDLSPAQLCGLVTAAVAARLTGSLLWGLSAAMAGFILVGMFG